MRGGGVRSRFRVSIGAMSCSVIRASHNSMLDGMCRGACAIKIRVNPSYHDAGEGRWASWLHARLGLLSCSLVECVQD